MNSSAFNGYGNWVVISYWFLFSLMPLGLWKLVEIIIWLYQHVEIGIK